MARNVHESSSINQVSRSHYSSIKSVVHDENESSLKLKFGESGDQKTKNIFVAAKELIRGPQRLWTVILLSLIAAIGSSVTGMSLGYSSPASLSINSTFRGDIMRINAWKVWANSVFGSILNVGAIIGSLFAILIADRAGRKITLLFSNCPTVIGWLLIICASLFESGSMWSYFSMLFVGRLFTGIGAGWTSVIVPMYIVEISPTLGKGLFGSLNQLAVTIGVFAVEALPIRNGFFNYTRLAIVPMVLILTLVILVALFLRETPRWLVSRGNVKEAAGMLAFLRGVQYDDELEEIQTEIHSANNTFYSMIKFMKKKPAYLALVFSLSLLIFQQVCGINAIIFYGSRIFKAANFTSDQANIFAAVGIGVIQVIGTFIAAVLVDICGRKLLLFIGSAGSFVSTFVLGIFFLLKHNGASPPSALPVLCVILFITSFALSWGPIPWVMVNEFSPITVRALIVGIATATNWLFSTLVTGLFDIDIVQKYSHVVWLIFSAMSVLSIVFICLLPETKGRSLQKIVRDLEDYQAWRVRKIC